MSPISEVVAHVDGSCRHSGTSSASAGLGAIIKLDDVRFARVAIPCTGPERATSTVAELSAALFALEFGAELAEQLFAAGFSVPQAFSILSDCEHVTKVFSGELTSYKFRRLWSAINGARERLDDAGVAVRAVQEPAHAGYPGNEEADKLAKRASRRYFRGRRRTPRPYIKCLLRNCSGSKYIDTAAELAEHVCAEHIYDLEPAPYECDLCDSSFLTYQLLTQHHEAVHNETSSEDEVDADNEREDEEDDEEEEYSDVESDADCPFCGYTYYAEDIEEHIRLEHAEEAGEDDGDDESSGSGATSDSDYDTTDNESGSNWTDSEEDESDGNYAPNHLYECCFCDHHSSSLTALAQHWAYQHRVEIEDAVLQCGECALCFPGHYYLSSHSKTWHDIDL